MARARDVLWKQAGMAGLLAGALVLLLYVTTDVLQSADRWLYDAGVATALRQPATDFVIVDAGDAAQPGLLQSARLAELTARLSQAGAALVVLALPAYPEPQAATAEGDAQLARSLRDSGRVVLAWLQHAPADRLAKEALAQADMALMPDADGVLRSQRLFAGADGRGAPVAALVVAAQRLGVPLSQLRRIAGNGAHLGPTVVPLDDDDSVRPHFYRGSGGAPAFERAAPGDVLDATRWARKVVFVGPLAPDRAAPLRTAAGDTLAPVEALAHVASALSQRHLVVRPPWANGVVALLAAAMVALLMWRLPALPPLRRLAAAGMLTAAFGMAQWLLPLVAGWWLPLALPVAVLWIGVAALAVWPRGAARALAAGPAAAAAEQAPPPSPARAAPAGARPRLGRYIVEREIGRGAMGAVYLARDAHGGPLAAIKTLRLGRDFDGAALDEARQRFVREAHTAQRLRHPDIVAVHDAGETRELAWIAMEHLPGRDLSHHVRAGGLLPVPMVVRIVARVACALAHAHRQGIVHRDVKPANVMFDAATDTVKITDFGIAHIADACRTRTGLVLGTPSFMSPEQLSGDTVDGRSDLYSLGVTLYQLLTARLPHEADAPARLMAQIANDVAPDARRWRPELPADLAAVVARALEKRPALRYADGDQMARDLRAVEAALGARNQGTMPDSRPPVSVSRP